MQSDSQSWIFSNSTEYKYSLITNVLRYFLHFDMITDILYNDNLVRKISHSQIWSWQFATIFFLQVCMSDVFHWSRSMSRHCSGIIWVSRRFKASATQMFGQQPNNEQNTKAVDHRPVVRGIHGWPLDSPMKGPVTQRVRSCHDVIMQQVIRTDWNTMRWML